jgi:hypothetical protein
VGLPSFWGSPMSPTNAARQANCLHPRKWFYRTAFRFTAGRPSVGIVERCQECGHLLRADVPVAELEAKGMPVSALDQDPWGAQ